MTTTKLTFGSLSAAAEKMAELYGTNLEEGKIILDFFGPYLESCATIIVEIPESDENFWEAGRQALEMRRGGNDD